MYYLTLRPSSFSTYSGVLPHLNYTNSQPFGWTEQNRIVLMSWPCSFSVSNGYAYVPLQSHSWPSPLILPPTIVSPCTWPWQRRHFPLYWAHAIAYEKFVDSRGLIWADSVCHTLGFLLNDRVWDWKRLPSMWDILALFFGGHTNANWPQKKCLVIVSSVISPWCSWNFGLVVYIHTPLAIFLW